MLGQASSPPWLRMSPYPYVPARVPKHVQPLSLRPSLECPPHDSSRPLTNLRMGDDGDEREQAVMRSPWCARDRVPAPTFSATMVDVILGPDRENGTTLHIRVPSNWNSSRVHGPA